MLSTNPQSKGTPAMAEAVFAELASITDEDVDELSDADQLLLEKRLFADLRRVMPKEFGELWPHYKGAARNTEPDGTPPAVIRQIARSNLVYAERTSSRDLILRLVHDGKYRLGRGTVFLQRKGRVVERDLRLRRTHRTLIVGKLEELARQQPFPFGQCRVCDRIFVQARRGKERRYCSDRCKARGVPSAPKRTEYTRIHRQRKRAKEVAEACHVIGPVRRDAQYARLERRFPKKSRPALLYLLKRAREQLGY